MEVNEDEVTESGTTYGVTMRRKYHGINLGEERSYSQEPDKEFKFYLGSLLLLFVIIYAVQAIMVYR